MKYNFLILLLLLSGKLFATETEIIHSSLSTYGEYKEYSHSKQKKDGAVLGLGGDINLSWSNYQGFYYDRFYIYRYTTSGVELLYTLGSDINSCTDPNPPVGIIKYFIAVEDTSGCNCLGSKTSGGPYSHSLSNLDDYGVATSINNNAITNGINIYPNPTTGKVFIEGENINFIEVLNVNGQTIYTKQVNANTTNIDLSNKTNGIYFIKIRNNNTVLTYKIILE